MKLSTTTYPSRRFQPIRMVPYLRAILFATLFALTQTSFGSAYTSVVIHHSHQAGKVEMNISNLLAERLREAGISDVKLAETTPNPGGAINQLVILLGIPEYHTGIKAVFKQQRIPPLTDLEPGREGFLLMRTVNPHLIIAAGVDIRGSLYATGELLRQATIRNGVLRLPEQLKIRTAPAFEIRGTQVQQSGVSLTLAMV
jgi:hypothetical protein